ncbi:MAG: methyltransferase domain-containing protein, partial [Candidatus Muiribacteriaceae bacterium]
AYCGTGIFSFLLKDRFTRIIGIDINSDNIRIAETIRKENSITNIEFYTGSVNGLVDSFSKADTLIFDPPRAGLSKKVLQHTIEKAPARIFYLSCDPATLQRDLKELTDRYDIQKICTFDMFPQTYHFESLAILKKKN